MRDYKNQYTEAKQSEFTLIPEGAYYAKAIDWSWSDKFDSISIKLEIVENADTGDTTIKGKSIFSNLYFKCRSEEDETKTMSRIKCLGIDDKINFQADNFVGLGRNIYQAMDNNVQQIKSTTYRIWVHNYEGKHGATLKGIHEDGIKNHAPQTAAEVASFNASEEIPF